MSVKKVESPLNLNISGIRASIFIPFFVVITGFNGNTNMISVVKLVVVFVVDFAMNDRAECRTIRLLSKAPTGAIYAPKNI